MNEDSTPLHSFWQHLDELRALVIQAFIAWCALFILFWLSYNSWIPCLTDFAGELSFQKQESWRLFNKGPGPVLLSLGHKSIELLPGQSLELGFTKEPALLHVFSPFEMLSVSVKTSLWLGAWCALPFWLWLVLRFVAPALHIHEKKWLLPAVGTLVFSWALSSALTPSLSRLLIGCLASWIPETIEPLWGLSAYVDFLLIVLLATASSLLLIALLFLATGFGLLSFECLKNAQKGAVLGSLIIGAILTPPDVLSQLALASVLLMAYYLALLLAWIKKAQ